jgi:hypothetical protein
MKHEGFFLIYSWVRQNTYPSQLNPVHTLFIYDLFFGTFATKLQKCVSYLLHVQLPGLNNSRTTELIFMKFDTEKFYSNLLTHFNFEENWT